MMKKRLLGLGLVFILLLQATGVGFWEKIEASDELFDPDEGYYITDSKDRKALGFVLKNEHGSSPKFIAGQGLDSIYSRWKLVYNSEKGAYKIMLKTGGTMLGISIDTSSYYPSAVTYSVGPDSGTYNSNNKYWIVTKNSDGTYTLSPKLKPTMVLAVSGEKFVIRNSNTSLSHKWNISARKIYWLNSGLETDDAAITEDGFLNSIGRWNWLKYTSYDGDDHPTPLAALDYREAFGMIADKDTEIVFVDTHCTSNYQQISFGVSKRNGRDYDFSIGTNVNSAHAIQNYVNQNEWRHVRLIVFAACGTGRDGGTDYPSIAKVCNTYCGARTSIGFKGILKEDTTNTYIIYGVDVERWQALFAINCTLGMTVEEASIAADKTVSEELVINKENRKSSLNPVIFGDKEQRLDF